MVKNIKFKKLLIFILTVQFFTVNFAITLATIQPISQGTGGLNIQALSKEKLDIKTIIDNVATFGAALIAAVAVLFVIYAAFLYLTSAGDPAKVAEASKYILWAIIASIVALTAFGIIALAKAVFGFA